MGDAIPITSIPRTADNIASAVFGAAKQWVNAWVGPEAWAEVRAEVADVKDDLFLNGMRVQLKLELAPRRIIIFCGSIPVADFDLPVKAVVPPMPGKDPLESVSH